MLIIVVLIVGLMSAFIGASMASSRGQNPLVWGVVCFLLPIIGNLILNFSDAGALKPDDKKRWEALIDADDDIAEAAETAREIDPRCEAMLAEKYLALNDKKYLKSLLKKTISEFDQSGPKLDGADGEEEAHIKSLFKGGLISPAEYQARLLELVSSQKKSGR